MQKLYHPTVSPIHAVEGTLARWYTQYLQTNGHAPAPDLAYRARKKIERIAHTRDLKLSKQGWS